MTVTFKRTVTCVEISMQKQQAINIVHETFESAFDKVRFTNFIKNLLNEPDLTDGFPPLSGAMIRESFRDYISKLERLGKFEDSEGKRIDILIVHLKRETSIERARSMQRNFVAGYLKGDYGSKNEKDAALVAFVSPNGEDWRFSLVKLEVRLDASDEGKLKVTDEFTPAKRWSFLVGSQEKSHTAQRQFVPIMQDTDNNPTLAQLEEAFNIETVTKEFFNAYRELFIRTKGELDKLVKKDAKVKADFDRKEIDTVNLAKKLLGQIVFLYYLQKKGWFGVPRDAAWGEGSRAFLRELFEKKHGEYKNFFNDVLEPLFYEALRIDRSNKKHIYDRFNCKIPFLNGGLFDPMNNYDWEKTDLLLPNTLFSNRTKDDPEGDGILDVFDLYNFTVKEDEPFEKEVAIDPELLGKAYEKFNAIRPDNYAEFLKALESGKKGEESKFNKQYGVYYTPREIVHYMCQQSLINYLHTELNPQRAHQGLGQGNLDMFGNAGKQGQLEITTEHAIEETSKEDIALLIQHGENWRENEERVQTAGKETETYSYKIPESIRMNAALLDEKLAAIKVCDPAVGSGAFPVGMMSEIVKARQALLTYTKTKKTPYDFKRECIENSLYGVDIDSGAVEIAKLRLWLSLVVDEDDPQNIKPLPNLDYKIVCGNSLIGVEKNLFNVNLFTELEALKPLYFNATNPAKKQEYKKKIDSLIDHITNGRAQFDFEIYFSEVFHEGNGFDVVIANPPYGANIDALTKILEKLYPNTAKSHKDSYKIFIELGLMKLAVENGVVAYIVPNTLLRQPRYKDARDFLIKYKMLAVVNLGENVFDDAVVPTCVFLVQKSPEKANQIMFKDLSSHSKFTGEFIDTSSITKLDSIFAIESDKSTHTMTLDVILDFKDAGINYQRVNVGMGAKGNSDLGQRLLYEGEQENAEDVMFWKGEDIDEYHIAKRTKRWVRIKTIRKLRENERVVLNKEYFERTPKLVWRQTASMPIVAIDDRGIWFGRSIQAATIKSVYKQYDYKFLAGLLNSKYMRWLYNERVKETGRVFPQVKLEYLKTLPFCKSTSEQQEKIVKLVEQVLVAKKKNPQADTSKEESAIDELVYQLYGLTEEEVKIVEGKE